MHERPPRELLQKIRNLLESAKRKYTKELDKVKTCKKDKRTRKKSEKKDGMHEKNKDVQKKVGKWLMDKVGIQSVTCCLLLQYY